MILKEELEVSYYEIDNDTKTILETFQEVIRTLLKIYHKNSSRRDKRGQIQSLKDFKELKKEMKRFHNYPFMKPLLKQINKINQEFIENFQSRRDIKKIEMPDIDRAIAVWKSGNIQQSIKVSQKFSEYTSKQKKALSKPLKNKFNPFYIENPLIFRSANFLEQFEQDDIEYVANLDLNTYKYSYLNLNEMSKNDFQYLAYFILKLSDKPTTTVLKGNDAQKAFKMAYSDAGSGFDRLLELVEEYLQNNVKGNIDEIVERINEFPDIKKANDNAKKSISTVYRGYPTEETKPRENIVATSKSKNVAMRFALQIGHLEGFDNRRSEEGTIETYEVTPDAIILDTTIFGGIYNEEEVIVDISKAKLIDIDEV